MRVLVDPVNTGAVVLSLPQDVQSHAYDYPAEFFAERDWTIRRPLPEPAETASVVELVKQARKPLIIAGGGVLYSDASAELEALAEQVGIPVAETFAGKGAVRTPAWWQLGGIGLEGNPATNEIAREADLVITVGSRLTDFATASHSLFANPDARFASINIDARDGDRLGAESILGDAKLTLKALATALADDDVSGDPAWRERVETATSALGTRARRGPRRRHGRGPRRAPPGDHRRHPRHRRRPDPGASSSGCSRSTRSPATRSSPRRAALPVTC